MNKRRVVITGMGVCSPAGRDINELEATVLNGNTPIRNLVEDFPWMEGFRVQIGSAFGKNSPTGEFVFEREKMNIPKKDIKKLSLSTQYGLEASYQAINESGILNCNHNKIGVCIGMGFGPAKTIEEEKVEELKKGLKKVSPFVVPKIIANALAGNIAILNGFHATESPTLTTACASGASGIISAYKSIILNEADMMVTGGTEEPFSNLPFASFGNMHAMASQFNDCPERASRPFDRNRNGFVAAEGSGILILEELEHAKKRGAPIYCELLGYGTSTDGYHETHPEPNAEFITLAMQLCLENSGIKPEQIDYINAHGTSTYDNDPLESFAIKRVFKEHAKNLEINSSKSLLGHQMGATGGIETIITALSIKRNQIHKTANLEEKDLRPYKYKSKTGEIIENPEAICDLNYTTEPKEKQINYALSNGFGFFGHNTVLCLGKI